MAPFPNPTHPATPKKNGPLAPSPRPLKTLLALTLLLTSALQAQTNLELAGNPTPTNPHFRWVQNFNLDQPLHIAIDGKHHPSINNITADVYIVQDRTATEWLQNPTLTDITPGGALTCTFSNDSIQQNTFQLTAPNTLPAYNGPQIGIGYDIVIDTDQDGQLSPPDFIDGEDGPGFYVIHDITQPGAYAVTTQDWTHTPTLLKRIWYPSNIASLDQLPLIVISHGWTYNYTFYDYIGEHLASYGYIVMSHRNNVGAGDPAGTNSASLSLIANLDHLLANQDTLWGGVLDGKIDHHHMGWMGHSTGGESPVRAYTRLHDGQNASAYFNWTDVQYISSLCPVAWLSPSQVNPYEVNYHQFLGGADTDVSGDPVDTYTQPLTIFERGTGNKHVIYVHGAGHGVFHGNPNGLPYASGPDLINRAQLHPLVQAYTLAMSDLYCKQNPAGKEFFTRSYSEYRPMNANDSVVISNEFRDGQTSDKTVIDDFQTSDSLELASSGATVQSNLQNSAEVLMQDYDTSFAYSPTQPANGMTRARYTDDPHCLVMEWDTAGFIRYTIPDQIKDFSTYEFLTFRACQRTHHPFNIVLDSAINFHITLTDEDADSATIPIAPYGPIIRTYQRGGGWQNEFCTVRIRLSEFLTNDTLLDLNAIENLTFHFGNPGASPTGALGIDDIELVTEQLNWPTAIPETQAHTSEDIIIYPNPSTGTFLAAIPHPIEEGTLEIFTLHGQKIHSEALTHLPSEAEEPFRVTIHLQARGLYLLRVTEGENTYHKKVLIE